MFHLKLRRTILMTSSIISRLNFNKDAAEIKATNLIKRIIKKDGSKLTGLITRLVSKMKSDEIMRLTLDSQHLHDYLSIEPSLQQKWANELNDAMGPDIQLIGVNPFDISSLFRNYIAHQLLSLALKSSQLTSLNKVALSIACQLDSYHAIIARCLIQLRILQRIDYSKNQKIYELKSNTILRDIVQLSNLYGAIGYLASGRITDRLAQLYQKSHHRELQKRSETLQIIALINLLCAWQLRKEDYSEHLISVLMYCNDITLFNSWENLLDEVRIKAPRTHFGILFKRSETITNKNILLRHHYFQKEEKSASEQVLDVNKKETRFCLFSQLTPAINRYSIFTLLSAPDLTRLIQRTDKQSPDAILRSQLEINNLITLILQRQEKLIDNILSRKPNLLLQIGQGINLFGHQSSSLTPLQCAVKVGDWYIWKILLNHFKSLFPNDSEAETKGKALAKEQIDNLNIMAYNYDIELLPIITPDATITADTLPGYGRVLLMQGDEKSIPETMPKDAILIQKDKAQISIYRWINNKITKEKMFELPLEDDTELNLYRLEQNERLTVKIIEKSFDLPQYDPSFQDQIPDDSSFNFNKSENQLYVTLSERTGFDGKLVLEFPKKGQNLLSVYKINSKEELKNKLWSQPFPDKRRSSEDNAKLKFKKFALRFKKLFPMRKKPPREITKDLFPALFEKILSLCNYSLPVLPFIPALIKKIDDKGQYKIYVWGNANGKWKLSPLDEDETLLFAQLPFPASESRQNFKLCNTENNIRITKTMYTILKYYHAVSGYSYEDYEYTMRMYNHLRKNDSPNKNDYWRFEVGDAQSRLPPIAINYFCLNQTFRHPNYNHEKIEPIFYLTMGDYFFDAGHAVDYAVYKCDTISRRGYSGGGEWALWIDNDGLIDLMAMIRKKKAILYEELISPNSTCSAERGLNLSAQ